MAVITSSMVKITCVVAEITFKVVVTTSSVVVVADIIFKVAVITTLVVKVTFKKWHPRM